MLLRSRVITALVVALSYCLDHHHVTGQETASESPTTIPAPPSTAPEQEPVTDPPTTAAPATVPPTTAAPVEASPPPTAQQPTAVTTPPTVATVPPTAAAVPPTAAAVPPTATTSTECYTTLSQIDDDERLVTDVETPRTYILCPDTNFETGFLTNSGEILGGDAPLTLRKNMRILCGNDGSSENGCVISKGSFGVVALGSTFDTNVVNTGVLVQGVTFQNLAITAMALQIAGDFQFVDCIFTDNVSEDAPIVVEWDGGTLAEGELRRRRETETSTARGRYQYSSLHRYREFQKSNNQTNQNRQLQPTATTLRTDFVNCVFRNNACAPDSRLGIVMLGGDGLNTKFTNCVLEGNDCNVPNVNDANLYGIIIEHFGSGTFAIENSCFLNNKAFGNALVAEYGTALGTYTNNYGEGNAIEFVVDMPCDFAALVDGEDQNFPNVACADFDATECAADSPVPPTPALAPTPATAPTQIAEAETEVPTTPPAPTAPPGPCYTSLTVLDDDEKNVTDLEVVRTYVLCPNTTFYTGFLTNNGDILGGDRPLTLRKNMHVLCGNDGRSENGCIIARGSFGLSSIPLNFDNPVENTGVIVRGVIFQNAAIYAMLIGLAGHFQFIDCIYRDNVSEDAPLLLEWNGGRVTAGEGSGGGGGGGGDTGGNDTATGDGGGGDTGGNDTATGDGVDKGENDTATGDGGGGDTGGNDTVTGDGGGGDTGGNDTTTGDGGGGDTGGNDTATGDGVDTGGNGTATNSSARQLEAPRGRYSYTPLEHHRHSKQPSGSRDLQVTTTLKIEFIDCVFQNNKCAPESRLGLIILGGDGMDTSFTNCTFDNNDYNVPGVNDASFYGIIVENFGNGPLVMEDSCFTDNRAFGNSLVAAYGNDIGNYSNIYGEGNSVDYVVDLECEFAALVNGSSPEFPNLACVDFDAEICAVQTETFEPSSLNSPAPSTEPVVQPTIEAPVTTRIPTVATEAPSSASSLGTVLTVVAMCLTVMAI